MTRYVMVADLNSIGFETEARQGKTYVFLRDISMVEMKKERIQEEQ